MKPSDIASIHPFGSKERKTECEIIARNIAVIQKRTGDIFREIDWEEYSKEREKDGAKIWRIRSEKKYFERVKGYMVSEDTARLFSDCWDIK